MLMKKFRDIDHAKYKVGQLVVESALVARPDPTGSTGRGRRSCGLTRPNRLSQLKRSLDVELAITRRSWEFRADINTSLDTAISLCHRLRLFSYLDRHVSLVLHSNFWQFLSFSFHDTLCHGVHTSTYLYVWAMGESSEYQLICQSRSLLNLPYLSLSLSVGLCLWYRCQEL